MGDVDIPSPSRAQVSPAVARQVRHRPPKRLSAVASSKVPPFSELPVNRPAFIPMSVWQSLSDEHRRELIDSLFPSNVALAAHRRASSNPVFTHFSDTELEPQLVHDALNVEPLAFSTYGDTRFRFVPPVALRVG